MAGERHIMSIFITENKTSICAAHILSLRTAIANEGGVECALISQNYRLFSKVRIRTFLFRFFFFYYLYLLSENNTYFFIKSNIFLLFWQQGFFTFFSQHVERMQIELWGWYGWYHALQQSHCYRASLLFFLLFGFPFLFLRLFKGSRLCWILWCPCWHIKVFLSFSTRKKLPSWGLF